MNHTALTPYGPSAVCFAVCPQVVQQPAVVACGYGHPAAVEQPSSSVVTVGVVQELPSAVTFVAGDAPAYDHHCVSWQPHCYSFAQQNPSTPYSLIVLLEMDPFVPSVAAVELGLVGKELLYTCLPYLRLAVAVVRPSCALFVAGLPSCVLDPSAVVAAAAVEVAAVEGVVAVGFGSAASFALSVAKVRPR